jgi:hypothetical protein
MKEGTVLDRWFEGIVTRLQSNGCGIPVRVHSINLCVPVNHLLKRRSVSKENIPVGKIVLNAGSRVQDVLHVIPPEALKETGPEKIHRLWRRIRLLYGDGMIQNPHP